MNRPAASTQLALSDEQRNAANTLFHGYWLVLVRLLWIALAALILVLYVVGFPAAFQYLKTVCVGGGCNGPQLSLVQARALEAYSLSPDFYATYLLMFQLLFAVVWFLVATVIFWRKSNERLAWFVSLMLLTFGATFPNPLFALAQQQPIWRLPINVVVFLGITSIVLCFYLFPDGRFAPRWTALVGLLWLLGNLFWIFLMGSIATTPLWNFFYLGVLGLGVFAQIYRYLRVSNAIQRQQTKWVVYGFTIAILAFLALNVAGLILPSSLRQSPFSPFVVQPAYYVFILFIPVSISIAILRSHLWDIDLLINRTLVYSTLTGILALVYIGLIITLQFLLRGIINQRNDVAIVVSTLAIAALFQPLRHGIQQIIDRRFYRRKYDATRALAAFSATLRDEVDLSQLSEQLLAVVQETMQPTHASLWLRDPQQYGQRKTRRLPRIDEEEKVAQ